MNRAEEKLPPECLRLSDHGLDSYRDDLTTSPETASQRPWWNQADSEVCDESLPDSLAFPSLGFPLVEIAWSWDESST